MRNVPCSLGHSNTQSPGGGAVWEGLERKDITGGGGRDL